MREACTNEPTGRRYNQIFGEWLTRHGFDDIDKGDRSRLFEVMENLDEIEGWLATLPTTNRLRLNHPATVLRKWRAKTQTSTRSRKPSPKAAHRSAALQVQLTWFAHFVGFLLIWPAMGLDARFSAAWFHPVYTAHAASSLDWLRAQRPCLSKIQTWSHMASASRARRRESRRA
jgi:hypothetical protein